jgi:hypothetical protein
MAVTDITISLWINGSFLVRDKSLRTTSPCWFRITCDVSIKSDYNPCRKCSSALRFAPASSSKPVRNAQNIKLTESANGP